MKENRDRAYLQGILESISRIERFLANIDFAHFAKNEMIYDATLMQLINIGEMVNRLTEDFQEGHNYLPWHKAIGMRNQIAHGYFKIDPKEIWRTV